MAPKQNLTNLTPKILCSNTSLQNSLLKKFLVTLGLLLAGPASSWAVVASSFEAPDTVLAANTGVEIIKHAGGIWVATGAGVNFTFDNGQTWLLYDSTNGLSSDNLSSIFSQNNRLWVGANHTELVNNSPTSLADGLFYTDNLGDNWIKYDFNAIGIDKIYGVSRQIFDITGHYNAGQNEDWLFIAAFAGAMLASRDGGTTWRRIYPSFNDSIAFNQDIPCPGEGFPCYRMRYFSCAADTSHGDTLNLWGGTAEGIFQYVYVSPREKLFTKVVNQIAYCDDCSDPAGSYVFIGGNTGLTRVLKTGRPFDSRFTSDGLPGNNVTAVTDFRGRVLVGTANAAGTSSTGLAYSNDRGDTFIPVSSYNLTYAVGTNSNRIWGFDKIGERLYLAAESAGLFVSSDSGLSWTHIFVDTLNITLANRRNAVFSLEAVGDTLRVGTDSGLVQLFLDPGGLIDSSRFYVFGEDTTTAGRITHIRTQRFFTGATLDSSAIWTVNQRITVAGTPMVGRSNDRGITWDRVQIGQGVADLSRDVNFLADTVIIIGVQGMREIRDYVTDVIPFSITITDSTNTDRLNSNILTAIEINGDTIIIGTNNGIAMSNNRGSKYKIHRANTDSLAADIMTQSTYENASPLLEGITGNFIPAMEVQYVDSGPAIVWASNRPTSGGREGIAVGAVIQLIDTSATPDDTLQVRQWLSQYDQFAWNFAFNGDTAFAATDSGLIYTVDTGYTWDTMQFIDTNGDTLYDSGRPVFGVAAIDSFLWVGADDRILRVNLYDLSSEGFFVIDSGTGAGEVYAFPVPFSNVQDAGGGIKFRFALEQNASVTIEVYDFAMNLVKRVIDNKFFTAGFYPTATESVQWDALNGQGDQLAVGVYYFKVTLSTGETRWGKLAVIP